jgi:replicative DNA helicase
MAESVEGFTLPVSVETEEALLGTLLLKSNLWRDAADALRPADFSLVSHQRIFRAMLHLGREENGFDAETLAVALDGDLSQVGNEAYLTHLECGAVERRNIGPLCRIIREKSILRRFARSGEALIQAACSPGAKPEDCRVRAAELLTLCDEADQVGSGPARWKSSFRWRSRPVKWYWILFCPPKAQYC